ncbi:MAG: hypothetical protein WA364_11505 [Candidatus Nitrosopolaris sp.]
MHLDKRHIVVNEDPQTITTAQTILDVTYRISRMLQSTTFKLNVNLLGNVNLKRSITNKRFSSIITTTIIAVSLFSAATLLSLQDNVLANAQNQSQTTKAKSTNASAPPIGNIQQLSKAVGNNSKILSSNVKIGSNPNFTQPKVTAATPPNGLTSNPTKAKTSSNSTSSATSSSNAMNKGAKAGGAAAAGNMSKAGGAAANTTSKVLTNASKVVGSGLKGLGNAVGAGLKGLGNLISPGKK